MSATLTAIEKPAPAIRFPLLGFVGLGWIGCKRLESVVESNAAEIVALADPSDELRARAGALVPDAMTFRSLSEVLALDLDGVVIATPNALHASQTVMALERGVSVFCQKPLGRDAREVREIVDAARRNDRLLGVDLSYRHLEGMQKIRELVRTCALGRIFAVDLVFHNAYGPDKPWFYQRSLSGGGCVTDLAVHLIDAAFWCLDTTASAVSSRVFFQGYRQAPEESVEDAAFATIDLGCGAVANLSCSWKLHAGKSADIQFTFYGTEGGATVRNVDGSFFDFQAHRFAGMQSELIASPSDAWQGGSILQWIRDLQINPAFDDKIERQIAVAETLDAIHAARTAPLALAL